ncbi:MAG: hypothetical protein NTZ08_09345 [Verrucomicrobia bacterium]|nr:hypothetical protein [Verrucomicrobiota bacterium]
MSSLFPRNACIPKTYPRYLLLAAVTFCALPCASLKAANLYWDSNGATAGAGATPNGTWGVNSFWNTAAAGTAGTFSTGMTQADDGYFSAGTDAINAYTVTVNGTQAAGNLFFQEGTPTLTGGTIALGAAKTLTAVATLNGTATIASALTVNSTAGNTTLTLTANDGAAATDLLITGPISATSANTYQLRFSGAGNARIEGAISGHGGTLGASTWNGTVTIAGNQNLGSSKVDLTYAGNKLVMGNSTSDVQSSVRSRPPASPSECWERTTPPNPAFSSSLAATPPSPARPPRSSSTAPAARSSAEPPATAPSP